MRTPLGQAMRRVDGRLKVTGQASYSSDVSLPNMVFGHLVLSTLAQGRITAIDTAAAEAATGVITIITHLNAPKLQPLSFDQPGQPSASAGHGFLPLQDDRIYFNGQVIGVVVAATQEQAAYAASLVKASYEQARPKVDLAAAGAECFRPEAEGVDYQRGSVDEGIKEAAVCIRPTYWTAVNHHNPMAPFATVATWEGERLTVYDATQGVHLERKVLAEWLALPRDHVRVISPFVGGGFGAGLRTNAHSVLAAIAARQVGRPVKLVPSRAQMYTLVGHRPPSRQEITLAARRDGTLTAIRHAVLHTTSLIDEYLDINTKVTQMLYACPNLAASSRLVRLSIDTPSSMRAPPQVNGVFALESAMDELAYALEIDPMELRLRNYADQDPQSGLPWSSKSLRACYAQGAARIGWAERNLKPGAMRNGRYRVGLGMATTTYPTYQAAASARVQLLADGTALVQSGSADIGPGTYTVMTQIAAAALGIPAAQVRFELGDSALPFAPVQGGSMTVASVGSAVQAACLAVRDQLAGLIGKDMNSLLAGSPPDAIRISGDRVQSANDPARSERLKDLLARHGLDRIEAKVRTQGAEQQDRYSSHAFGAHFAKVQVDPDSSEVRVIRFVSAIAAARILNPKTARSQIIGGIVGGIGHALLEQTEFDHATGRIINANLSEYLVPVNADIPDLEVIFIDEDDSHVNPLGAKGIGEIPIVGVAPAIANAVFHATGIRVRHLPILPDKLLA